LLQQQADMLSSPPHHCMHYLISHSPSAEDFRELFDCPSYFLHNVSPQTTDPNWQHQGPSCSQLQGRACTV